MTNFKSIDEKVMAGYDYIMKRNTADACDTWLDAWEDIKSAIVEIKAQNIKDLQDKYTWTEFLSNYIQELAFELHNAGVSNMEYFRKRIKYCEEMLELCGEDHGLLVENTRRAIADSHYELGDKDTCDQLYNAWLEENPDWGWGYIGWADCYWNDSSNLFKSEEILKRALSRESVNNRADVLERAIDLYEELGKHQEAAVLRKGAQAFQRSGPLKYMATPIRSEKVGMNDPCPCGSGKKYKKCCVK